MMKGINISMKIRKLTTCFNQWTCRRGAVSQSVQWKNKWSFHQTLLMLVSNSCLRFMFPFNMTELFCFIFQTSVCNYCRPSTLWRHSFTTSDTVQNTKMINLDDNVRTSVCCWTHTSGERRHASSGSVKFEMVVYDNPGKWTIWPYKIKARNINLRLKLLTPHYVSTCTAYWRNFGNYVLN